MKQTHSWGMLLLLVFVGLILGGLIGDLLGKVTALTWLDSSLLFGKPILDMSPVTLNLYSCKIMFAVSIYPNLLSILGIVVAIFVWRKI